MLRSLLKISVLLTAVFAGAVLAGMDQPWNEIDDYDGSDSTTAVGVLVFAAAAYGIFKTWPLQTIAFVSAVLVAWVASLLVGGPLGILFGVLFLVWLGGGFSLKKERAVGRDHTPPTQDVAPAPKEPHIDTCPGTRIAQPRMLSCPCGAKMTVRNNYSGNVRCSGCRRVHRVEAVEQ